MRSAARAFLPVIFAALFLFAGAGFDANAQTESVIYSFTDGSADGAVPAGGLTFHKGSIFGVTNEGGGYNEDGVLFQLTPDGNGNWNESPVHVFEGESDGAVPSPVIFDTAGNLYGEAVSFGEYGYGLVFEFSPTASGWKMKVLYNFTGGSDGGHPEGGLTFDAGGNLYGTTGNGGNLNDCQWDPWNLGCGVVFELSPAANGTWTESVLYTFTGQGDGYSPEGGLTFDSQGNLYGATEFYGFNNRNGGYGVVYRLSPQDQGEWEYSPLRHFAGGESGEIPFGNLVVMGDSIFGTTWEGGMKSACNGLGCGIAYELSGTIKEFKILHTFTGGADGGSLFSPLTLANGRLFGTTQLGGDPSLCQGTGGSQGDGCGVVYSTNNDGDGPDGRMTVDEAGNLYGESRIGGTYDLGAIFEIAP
jgi:hypothetical protein